MKNIIIISSIILLIILNCAIVFSSPTISFISQTPGNITSVNLFNQNLTIRYNITGEPINTSSVRIYFAQNLSLSPCGHFTNGTQQCDLEFDNQSGNSSTEFRFALDLDNVFPGTYTYDEEYVEHKVHSYQILNNRNQLLKYRVYNFTANSNYSFFECMANTSGVNALQIYYCNSSYSSGLMDNVNSCGLMSTVASDMPFNHTHNGGQSSHHITPFFINRTTNTIANVKVTPTSYFTFRTSAVGSVWNIYQINNQSTGTFRISTNNGNTWSNHNFVLDSHIHQFQGNETFYYFVSACNTSVIQGCTNSTIVSDPLDLGNLPPTIPIILTPETGKYNGTIGISYTESVSPNNYNITKYNITLYDNSDNWKYTIASNNYPNTEYNFDSTLVNDGFYHIHIQACDLNDQCSTGISEVFEIDNLYTNADVTEDLLDDNYEGLSNLLKYIPFMAIGIVLIFITSAFLFKGNIENGVVMKLLVGLVIAIIVLVIGIKFVALFST